MFFFLSSKAISSIFFFDDDGFHLFLTTSPLSSLSSQTHHSTWTNSGTLACLDGYLNIAMEQTEVREKGEQRETFFIVASVVDFSSTSSKKKKTSTPTSEKPKTNPPPKKQEYVNGQLKNKYGDAFIRGNNVLYISTDKGASSS